MMKIECKSKKEPGFQHQAIDLLTGETVGWYASRDLAFIDADQKDKSVDVSYRAVRRSKR